MVKAPDHATPPRLSIERAAAESFRYGVYVGLTYVPIYNALKRCRDNSAQP